MTHAALTSTLSTGTNARRREALNLKQQPVKALQNESDCFLNVAKAAVERMLTQYNVQLQPTAGDCQ